MSGLIAPTELPSGSRAWVAPEVRDFTDRLAALDPRLALVQNADTGWSIFRVPENGSDPVCIVRSKPGAKLSPEIIETLRQRDTRHGHTPMEEIIRHNAKVQKNAEEREIESKFVAIDNMLSKSWRGRVPATVEGFETML